ARRGYAVLQPSQEPHQGLTAGRSNGRSRPRKARPPSFSQTLTPKTGHLFGAWPEERTFQSERDWPSAFKSLAIAATSSGKSLLAFSGCVLVTHAKFPFGTEPASIT